MNTKNETGALGEKHVDDGSPYVDPEDRENVAPRQNILHRDLQGRHMQMIAM
jgi:amino acid permease